VHRKHCSGICLVNKWQSQAPTWALQMVNSLSSAQVPRQTFEDREADSKGRWRWMAYNLQLAALRLFLGRNIGEGRSIATPREWSYEAVGLGWRSPIVLGSTNEPMRSKRARMVVWQGPHALPGASDHWNLCDYYDRSCLAGPVPGFIGLPIIISDNPHIFLFILSYILSISS